MGPERPLKELLSSFNVTKTKSSQSRYRVLVACWTKSMVQLTNKLTLPSLLSSKNLGELDQLDGCVPATILCLAADRSYLESLPNFHAFAKGRDIAWYFIDEAVALLGNALEAVVAVVFRNVMASSWKQDNPPVFILVKPGFVIADGSLSFAAGKIAEGANAVVIPIPFVSIPAMLRYINGRPPDFSARSLALAVRDDPIIQDSPLSGLETPWGFPQTDRLMFTRGSGHAILVSARWHPLVLRPTAPIEAHRQSLFDTEIVPEFAADGSRVHHIRNSAEAFVLDVRSTETLAKRFAGQYISAQDAVEQMLSWATPWQICNLTKSFELVFQKGNTIGSEDQAGIPELHLPPDSKGVDAKRHPLWLEARGMRAVSPKLASEKRYQSPLDGYYRVARLAIEAVEAEEAIYAGGASEVFAPLLTRHFRRTYIAALNTFISGPAGLMDPEKRTLHIVHVDTTNFVSLFLSDVGNKVLSELMGMGQPFILLVEFPDFEGGLSNVDFSELKRWYQRVMRLAGTGVGSTLRTEMTQIDFFEGHPGFLLQINDLSGGKQQKITYFPVAKNIESDQSSIALS